MINKRKVARVRAKIWGTDKRPRLSVYRSLTKVSAQLIDDDKGVTIASASGLPEEVGKTLAARAKENKISSAVFDRRGYKYHGKIKIIAESARENGLKI